MSQHDVGSTRRTRNVVSGARNAPYHPFQRAECARVCFVVKLVRLRKKILLKVSNNALPKPVLAGGRAARLSHDVVMLSEEES